MTCVDPPGATHGGPDFRGVPLHDFSTNANACGPCPAASLAMTRVDARRYPDPSYRALRDELASYHGVDAARIVMAASASEFIGRITAAVAQLGGQRVLLPEFSYGDYATAAAARGLQVHARPVPGAHFDLTWCCDPSSPLGQPEPDLGARVDGLDARSTCVLDLAYEPLRLEGRLALTPAQRDRVWQLWTPNKALGMTGVRAAYAIAPRDASATIALVNRLAPSWVVGAHGVALLAAWATEDAQAWLAESRARLGAWKSEQQALCESFGWTCLPSVANYFCARPDSSPAPRAEALRLLGVKLRDTESFGLPGHVRLGVLPPASQRALRDAWRAA